jgi:hypothetical protein
MAAAQACLWRRPIPRTLHPTLLGAAPEPRRSLPVVPLIRDQRYYGEAPARLRRAYGPAGVNGPPEWHRLQDEWLGFSGSQAGRRGLRRWSRDAELERDLACGVGNGQLSHGVLTEDRFGGREVELRQVEIGAPGVQAHKEVVAGGAQPGCPLQLRSQYWLRRCARRRAVPGSECASGPRQREPCGGGPVARGCGDCAGARTAAQPFRNGC